jgi:hypothetical protein
MDASRPCEKPGPHVRTSPSYLKQVLCNRVTGHPGPHRCYDTRTFKVVAEWTVTYDPAPAIKVGGKRDPNV